MDEKNIIVIDANRTSWKLKSIFKRKEGNKLLIPSWLLRWIFLIFSLKFSQMLLTCPKGDNLGNEEQSRDLLTVANLSGLYSIAFSSEVNTERKQQPSFKYKWSFLYGGRSIKTSWVEMEHFALSNAHQEPVFVNKTLLLNFLSSLILWRRLWPTLPSYVELSKACKQPHPHTSSFLHPVFTVL